MKRVSPRGVLIVAALGCLVFWVYQYQKSRLGRIDAEQVVVTEELNRLNELQKKMAAEPTPALPEADSWAALEEARRELHHLRGEASRLRAAARWTEASITEQESATRAAMESIQKNQHQQQALSVVATKGTEMEGVADQLSMAFGALLRKNRNQPIPDSLERLREQLLDTATNEQFRSYYADMMDRMEKAMKETGSRMEDFELVQESRFFQDQEPRWFLRAKATTELPDGQQARPYWPVWEKAFGSREHREFRLSDRVHEDLNQHIFVVYDP